MTTRRPLTRPGRLVGVLDPVIQILRRAVFHPGRQPPMRHAIAGQLVTDQHPRYVACAFEQLAEKLLRRLLIAPTLHQDIEDIGDFSAIPAEGLSVNGLLAVWPSIVLYGRSARNPIKPASLFMRTCSHTLGGVIPRHGCLASC